MEVISGLLAVTVLLVALIAVILAWAVRSGQFDDLEGPAWRVLMDDDRAHGVESEAETVESGKNRPGATPEDPAGH